MGIQTWIKKIGIVLGVVCLCISLKGEHSKMLNVVTTQSILADWVKEITKNRVYVTILVPKDTDTHSFEATPKHVQFLAQADIIFEYGLGFEYWLNALYTNSRFKGKRISLSAELPNLISIRGHRGSCCRDLPHMHIHEWDPHTWLDVSNAMLMVSAITENLCEADPNNAAFYKKNRVSYLEELRKLDEYIQLQAAKLPKKNRLLISNHESFNYFCRRYEFEFLGSVYGSVSTDSVDPSALAFSKLVKLIKQRNVKALFTENIQKSGLIEELAKEAGLPAPKILYTGALSGLSGPAPNYIQMMKYNIDTIVNGLR